MKDSYDYLYRIGTTGITIVLGLLFGKVAEMLITLLSSSTLSTPFVITAISIVFTILLILIGMVGTVAYAHSELKIPYRPAYFLISLLFIALPLYISVQFINTAIILHPSSQLDKSFFNYGMIALLLSFISLLTYLSLAFIIDNPKGDDQKRKIPFVPFFTISSFHVGGVIFAFVAITTTDDLILMIISLIALFGAMFYLIFVWALRLTFGLN